MDKVAIAIVALFAVYVFRKYWWRIIAAKWYGTETEAFVSRIEENVVSSMGSRTYCAPVRVINYYVTFPAKNGIENEAKLLNPGRVLTAGTKVRIRYLPEQADCAVLESHATTAGSR